jgi:hypothetical protein
VVSVFAFIGIVAVITGAILVAVLDVAAFDDGDVVLLAGVDFLDPGVIVVIVLVRVIEVFVLVVLGGAQGGLFFRVGLLFGEQPFAILLGDLVVVGVDFPEGEEAVAIAAEVDERRLERRFDPRNLG